MESAEPGMWTATRAGPPLFPFPGLLCLPELPSPLGPQQLAPLMQHSLPPISQVPGKGHVTAGPEARSQSWTKPDRASPYLSAGPEFRGKPVGVWPPLCRCHPSSAGLPSIFPQELGEPKPGSSLSTFQFPTSTSLARTPTGP